MDPPSWYAWLEMANASVASAKQGNFNVFLSMNVGFVLVQGSFHSGSNRLKAELKCPRFVETKVSSDSYINKGWME